MPEKLRDHFDFYVLERRGESSCVIRLVTSWATQEMQVDAFAAKVEEFAT